ncbi:Isochorismatase-like protein [Echria macrotheca]|uniref:Isochorismatase-like protein n=1 Tax=Echria macrotheca TaxID=438768 RepID=A0AAJ0B5X8_9PEZI|nr:Isochorismatase-like protein [Echria macrotheca]
MAPAAALFYIDIQKGIADDREHEIPAAARIRHAGAKILETARSLLDTHSRRVDESSSDEARPALIVFIQHEEPPEDGPLNRGSELWKLVFEPRDGVSQEWLVQKKDDDVFTSNPDLGAKLKASGIEHVIAIGIMSEYCVEESCKGALNAGFGVTLLSGAHSTYNREAQSATEIEREVEARLREKAVTVVGWEEAVAAWRGQGADL